jgi:hypothetical protein
MTRRINGWLGRTAMISAILIATPALCAQEETGDLEEAGAAIAIPRRPGLDEQGFLRSLLGGPNSTETLQEVLEFRLERRLEETEREYHLSPDQKNKLALAGRGDIKRFVDRVNEVRNQFLLVQSDRIEISTLLRNSKSFQKEIATGVFGDNSLFAKTFAKVISRQQVADAARSRRERELAWHRGVIADTVAKLSRSLSLTQGQRQRFERVLAEETTPPKKSGDSGVAYVMFQAARLPRSKLEPIFDEDQRRLLWKFLESYENIEEFLKDDGFIFDAPPLARHSCWAPGNHYMGKQTRGKTVQHAISTLEEVGCS